MNRDGRKLRWGMLATLCLAILLGGLVGGCTPAGDEAEGEGGGSDADITEIAETGAADVEDTGRPAISSDTFVDLVSGEPESLDPAWTYESAGVIIDLNLYEGLVAFDRGRADTFVPALAAEWAVSDDGRVYTFTVRSGVTFHEGGTLEPHDVAYSYHRTMLQDRAGGPAWLLLKPILGASTMTELATAKTEVKPAEGEEAPSLENLSGEAKASACAAVVDSVIADDDEGTVTIKLATPTPWFLQLAASWIGSVLDKEWMVEQGDWTGDCAAWTDWHDPPAEESLLYTRANGTGPYVLGDWKKGQSVTLTANEAYWRTAPIWEGGPSGPASIKTVVIQKVEEWGTRYTKLKAGEADRAYVPLPEIDQVADLIHTEYETGDESGPSKLVNADGILNLYRGYPAMIADAAAFNHRIEIAGGNEFIGSGKLDGEGIPPDFFSDVHVRRGFSYCFDWETYIAEALRGDGVQPRGPILAGLQGYREDSPVFALDLARCEEELAQAWDGQLPEVGFRLSVAYIEGGAERQAAAEILADGLSQVNPKYRLEPVRQQWPTLLENMNGKRLPMTFIGWYEDYHDASNWVYAYMHSNGYTGSQMSLPTEVSEPIDAMIDAATVEVDPDARDEMFAELQATAHDMAMAIFLHQWQGRTYLHRGVSGWYHNPLLFAGAPFYMLTKDGR